MKPTSSFVHSTFARRIYGLFVVCSLLPVCVFAVVSLQKVSSRLDKESQERLHKAAKNAGMAVIEGLTLLQAELETTSIAPGGVTRDSARSTTLPARTRSFRTITVREYDAGKGILTGLPGRLSPAANTHLSAGNALLLATPEPAFGKPLYMVTSVNRTLSGHKLVVGEINPEYLWVLVGYTLPPGIDICILAPSGNALYATRQLTPSLVSSVMAQRKKVSIGQLAWHQHDADYLVNYWSLFLKPILLADAWTVVAVQSKKDSVGTAHAFMTTFLLVVFLTMLVVIFASSVLIRRSLKPLSILREGADRLSGGDFNTRVQISSGDEFEALATSFNDMSQQLGNQFTSLTDMGILVQKILQARDQETIVKELLLHYGHSRLHEWAAIALSEVNSQDRFRTVYTNRSGSVTTQSQWCSVRLNVEEIRTLRSATEGLRITAGDEFAAILAPVVNSGAGEFLLQPIVMGGALSGILILGYRQAPKQIQEERVRLKQIAHEIAVALDNIRLIDELLWLNRGTMEVLAKAVDAKSPWTAGHSQRVTDVSISIGQEMGLSASELELLQLAGLFHDIGKIGIPEAILDKTSKLTEAEYAIIKEHPGKGAEILKPIRSYHTIIPIVAQHHEQYDGQGYPGGLSGEEIILGARIMAVADVFDALHSSRPYRDGWEISKVLSYITENSGKRFDPAVVSAFLRLDHSLFLESPAVQVDQFPHR